MAKITAKPPAPSPAASGGGGGATEGWEVELGEAAAASSVPLLPRSPPCLLLWHPERWGVVGGALVPLLSKLPLQNGVNRAVVNKAGKPMAAEALASRASAGWRLIPSDVDGPGKENSYVRKVTGIEAYLTRWEQAYVGSSQIGSDLEGYVKWLESLIARGIISPAQPQVVERLLAEAEARHGEALDRARTIPSAVPLAARYAAEVETLKAAMPARVAAASETTLIDVDL